MDMKKIFGLYILFFMVGTGELFAQNLTFVAKAPPSVVVNTPFQLSYTFNTMVDPNAMRVADVSAMEIIFGPSITQAQQNINGRSSSSTIVTYTLLPKKEGTYRIPAATITYNGKQFASNILTVTVLPPDKSATGGRANTQQRESSSATLSSQEIFLRAVASKTRVYEQEAILVTYKLYTVLDISNPTDLKFPDFKGFIMQQITPPANIQGQLEHFNGRNYTTYIINQVLLFPQHSGAIDIGAASGTFPVRIRLKQNANDPFAGFYDSFQDVSKVLTAPPIRITVDPLPANKPADFSGAVGDFKMTSDLSKASVKANESITLNIVISGTGNLNLINTLPVQFPHDFEAYPPKVNSSYQPTVSGISGTKTMEYLTIPRQPGDFVIPPVNFSYFDISSRNYRTISTPEYKVHVDKGTGGTSVVSNYTQKEDVKILNQDIRYINTDNFKVATQPVYLIKTLFYWLWLLIPFIIAVVLYFVFRKRIRDNANIALMKNKKANKMALKRLKQASCYLKEKKKEEFYDEVLKAYWGYLGDKLNIPPAELTKEKIVSELDLRGVPQTTTAHLMDMVNTCEFARYAPVAAPDAMDNLFNESVSMIEGLDGTIKKIGK